MSRQRGMTLVELMVVVAIIGVLMAVAVGSMDRDATPRDEAAAAAGLLREASRKAIAGGPIRDDVATANALTERARVRIATEGQTAIVLERADEDELPATSYGWVELRRHYVDPDVELFGFADATALDPRAETPVPMPSGGVTIACYPNGTCESKTLFFRDRASGKQRVRVVVMPCNGNPLVFDGW